MRRFAPLWILSVLAVAAAGCGTTDLEDVNLVGRWDGVGDLQLSDEGRELLVRIQSVDGGDIDGVWEREQTFGRSGAIDGTYENGRIEITLFGFPTEQDPTFQGELSSQHRMVGTFSPAITDGSAVFRRRSLDP